MRIFDFTDYKQFLKAWLRRRPKAGRGELLRFAEHLSAHPTLISQVLNGDKNFSQEHALQLADYLSLEERATEYFLLLVNSARAGSKRLKTFYDAKVEEMRAKDQEVASRLTRPSKGLTREQKGLFYSDWLYSAVRLLTSIPGNQTASAIARRLDADEKDVLEVLAFLSSCGLCAEKNGRYELVVERTHIAPDSRLVNRHHTNWRLRSIQKMEKRDSKDLFFTAPLTISDQDYAKVRALLLELIEKLGKIVAPSPAQTLSCIGLDWFRI